MIWSIEPSRLAPLLCKILFTRITGLPCVTLRDRVRSVSAVATFEPLFPLLSSTFSVSLPYHAPIDVTSWFYRGYSIWKNSKYFMTLPRSNRDIPLLNTFCPFPILNWEDIRSSVLQLKAFEANLRCMDSSQNMKSLHQCFQWNKATLMVLSLLRNLDLSLKFR